MAKVSTLRLLRLRIASSWRNPWVLLLLFAGDLAELVASVALAVLPPRPPPAPTYAAFDVPYVHPAPTLGVAILGVTLGILMGVGIVVELWTMARRAQILRWRAGRRRPLGARAVAIRSTAAP